MSKTSGKWFAWRPVRLGDTDKFVWLRWVYREVWANDCFYYSKDNPF